MRRIILLATLCCLAPALEAASVPFPSGLIPFNSIASETASNNGDMLVLGYTNLALTTAFSSIPFPSAQDELFSPSSIQLAPGRFFANVFVPTIAQRTGDFSAFPQPLINPFNGTPLSGNIIPGSLFLGNNGLFAFEVGPQATPTPEPSPAYLVFGVLFLIGWRWVKQLQMTHAKRSILTLPART